MREWKKTEDKYNGYNCERYIVNNIPVASYHHTEIRNDPKGEYYAKIYLPIIEKEKITGSREYVKSRVEYFVSKWINQISRE